MELTNNAVQRGRGVSGKVPRRSHDGRRLCVGRRRCCRKHGGVRWVGDVSQGICDGHVLSARVAVGEGSGGALVVDGVGPGEEVVVGGSEEVGGEDGAENGAGLGWREMGGWGCGGGGAKGQGCLCVHVCV